jgi:hypothetical protein
MRRDLFSFFHFIFRSNRSNDHSGSIVLCKHPFFDVFQALSLV